VTLHLVTYGSQSLKLYKEHFHLMTFLEQITRRVKLRNCRNWPKP